MTDTRKKAIVRTTGDSVHHGYLPSAGFVEQSQLHWLDLEGRVQQLPLSEIRWVAWVRDFNRNDRADPERLTRRTFLARPRSEGLWVRLLLHGAGLLEGLAPLDLTLLDGLLEHAGLFLLPPDIRSNTQRLFIPRCAIAHLEVLAVVTTPSRKAGPKPLPVQSSSGDRQENLFPEAEAR